MAEPCNLDEALLFDYVLGVASSELRAAVERSPECRASAAQLAKEVLPLLQNLYRVTCPDPETLVAYQERRLSDSMHQLMLYQHVKQCPDCQEELVLLGGIDLIPLVPPPSIVRRIIEAIYRSPLAHAQPVRGALLVYDATEFLVHLRVRQELGDIGRWTIRGHLRTLTGNMAIGRLEAVYGEQEGSETESVSGKIAEEGSFRLEYLPAGIYTLRLLTSEEEIVIRQLVVGSVS